MERDTGHGLRERVSIMEEEVRIPRDDHQEQENEGKQVLFASHCASPSLAVTSSELDECTLRFPGPSSSVSTLLDCPALCSAKEDDNLIMDQEKFVLCDSIPVSCELIDIVCMEQQRKKDSESLYICNDEERNGNGSTRGLEELLEAKKKQLLTELEDGSLIKNKTCTSAEDVGGEIFRRIDGVAGARSVGNKVKIEVIDDTALVIPMANMKFVNDGRKVKTKEKGRKKNNEFEEVKLDRPRQRKPMRRDSEVADSEKISCDLCWTANEMLPASEAMLHDAYAPSQKYSRNEMESLRFANMVIQRQKWRAIYSSLEASVVKGYDDMASSKRRKQKVQLNIESSQRHTNNKNAPGILGEVSTENIDNALNFEETDAFYVNKMDPEDLHIGSISEEENSDDDYSSIQRPAFLVEGEPDFDSGPPEDGLEYLRRVRWEAAQIPKIKVAKLDTSKMHSVQTLYMPQIPEIPTCPEHLLPLKLWEDSFLADFSNLRELLRRDEDAINEVKAANAAILGISVEESCNQKFEAEKSNSDNYPTLSAIMAMDSVARVSQLNKRIGMVESMASLSKEDCVWLFALCAAVDTPLHASTCAAIRNLLRKCATLRAKKCQVDDEVVMLNVIATIAGRFFGQSEI